MYQLSFLTKEPEAVSTVQTWNLKKHIKEINYNINMICSPIATSMQVVVDTVPS
jgi:hypothetical protein